MTKISIVIRSYNDIDYIEDTMKMISKQTYKDYEIVNVDCTSSDGTLDVLRKYNSNGKILTVSSNNYVPGKVLNMAVKECSGEIVVFNNSDCIPVNEYWLEEMVKGFNDPEVKVVFGNQLPRTDARPLIYKDNVRAFGDGLISGSWNHFFSLATSGARIDILKKFPFRDDLQYSEDIEWSYRLKQNGFKIAYLKNAKVYHSHNYTLKEVKKRFFNEGFAEAIIYKINSRFIGDFMLPLFREYLRDYLFLIKKGAVKEIPYGTIYRFVQRYNAYQGRKAYFKGQNVWPHLRDKINNNN